MTKYLTFLAFIIITGCDSRLFDPLVSSRSQKTSPPEIGEQFYLKIGETARFDNNDLSVKFESVPIDCRCPSGVLCIWEGYAGVSLLVTHSVHDSATLNLETYPGKDSVTFYPYVIELLDVTPYPVWGQEVDTTAYQAVMVVRKM